MIINMVKKASSVQYFITHYLTPITINISKLYTPIQQGLQNHHISSFLPQTLEKNKVFIFTAHGGFLTSVWKQEWRAVRKGWWAARAKMRRSVIVHSTSSSWRITSFFSTWKTKLLWNSLQYMTMLIYRQTNIHMGRLGREEERKEGKEGKGERTRGG